MFLTPVHVERLKGKVFKVLGLFEDCNNGLTNYIDSLIYELEGLRNKVNPKQDSILQTIISDLEHMYSDSLAPDPDLNTIKREIFGHMSLFDKMYELGED